LAQCSSASAISKSSAQKKTGAAISRSAQN
jgi:hypothetical protein